MRTKNTKISNAVIRRLPRYRRYLIELDRKGVDKISSKEFSELIVYTASQIRQDLNNFGGFGQQGYGYGVEELGNSLDDILGLNKTYNVAFIGCGRLGQALANYIAANEPAYRLCAMCDLRPEIIGQTVAGVTVLGEQDFDALVRKGGIDIIVLTVPADQCQRVCDLIENSSVKGVWNFSTSEMVIKGKKVMNMHLSDSLQALTYYINHPE